MSRKWPVQDAKAKFSELLDAALSEGPQIVTKRELETAVLLPIEQWRKLKRMTRPNLKELLLAPEARTEDLTPPRPWGSLPVIGYGAISSRERRRRGCVNCKARRPLCSWHSSTGSRGTERVEEYPCCAYWASPGMGIPSFAACPIISSHQAFDRSQYSSGSNSPLSCLCRQSRRCSLSTGLSTIVLYRTRADRSAVHGTLADSASPCDATS